MKFYDIPESRENNFSWGIGEICSTHEWYNLVIAGVKSENIVAYKDPHIYPVYECERLTGHRENVKTT
jgi:hypothetical protein